MHLAYVTMRLAPFDEGGPATVAYNLLGNFMKTKDVEVTLITGDSATEKDIINTFGNRFENIIRMPLSRSILAYTDVIARKTKEVWEVLQCVDVVHANNAYLIRNFYLPFFASLHRKPYVVTLHSIPSPEIQGTFHAETAYAVKNALYRTLRKLRKPLVSRVVVNSQCIRTIAFEEGFDEEKVHLIRNGIDFDGIKKAPRMTLDGDIKLLFVGHLLAVKGVDLLLEALSMLHPSLKNKIKMYIVGSAAGNKVCEEEYKSLVARLKLDKCIRFLGKLPLEKCYSLYKSCDIFVMPSRFEGFPIALLEALGSGIPIIATRVGGIPEIVKNNRNGFLVKSSPLEIAEKIEFLINHPGVREQMSRNNLIDAKKYSWQKITRQYLDLYESLA